MRDRDTVMAALKCCALDDCDNCAYTETRCTSHLCADALRLLNEPRVLEWSELVRMAEIESPPVWLEDYDKIHIIPALTVNSNALVMTKTLGFVLRWKRITVRSDDYGTRWRAWTAKPTEETRRAVKWDD